MTPAQASTDERLDMLNKELKGNDSLGSARTELSPPPVYSVRQDWLLWIGGKNTAAQAQDFFPVMNPATGDVLCRVARGRADDVDVSVRAASKALPAWARMGGTARGRMLAEVARRLAENLEQLAILETLHNGKPLRESRQDIARAGETFEFYASLADKLFGKTIPGLPDYLNYTVREPVGVTAHISPWNYPLRLAVRSVAPALAAGNTVILKPSEETPLTALRLAEILAESGVPSGVFNVVPGFGSEAGAALASHPMINHVSFTGSLPTGVKVMQAAAQNVVPVIMELGGKSPNIVFADADLEQALEGTIKGIFTNAGQVCCAGARLLLEQTVYDRFVTALIERTKQIHLGPGLNNPDMGPLISEKQRRRVLHYVQLGLDEGAELLLGGMVPSLPQCQRGYFFEPTLLANVPHGARVAREEIFGPVLTIFCFRTEAEAVRLANDSHFGLVAGVWTSDLKRAHKVASELQVGEVYINDFFTGSLATPFGGYKRSGFGRQRGVEALDHYTQVKSICVRL